MRADAGVGAGGRDVRLSTRDIRAPFAPRAATQKKEPQIIQPADHRNPPRGESYFGTSGENYIGIDNRG
jgi:hypothetical protein